MKNVGLACLAAVNPKLLAVDLILMGNRRPRLMFVCFLLGGMGLALTIGRLDVFVVHADAIQSQGSASAALDLCLGIPLLVPCGYWADQRCDRPGSPAASPRHRPRSGSYSSRSNRSMSSPSRMSE